PGALGVTLPGESETLFKLDAARGNAQGITTAGSFSNLVISDRLMDDIARLSAADAPAANEAGSNATVSPADKKAAAQALAARIAGTFPDIGYEGDWNLSTDSGLKGKVNVRRTSGDRFVPLAQKIPVDFETLSIDLNETRKAENSAVL